MKRMQNVLKILILEDNPDDLFLLKEMLNDSDEIEVEIIHAGRLSQAITKHRKSKVDAAILDLQVPDSFGLDTFLGFHKEYPNTPTIVLTGTKDYKLAIDAVKMGAQDYLHKGEFSALAIVRTIRYAIERQRLTSELKSALEEIKQLSGLLPICANCKKIRDDKGYWNRLESYIERHSDVSFSHGMCPECSDKLYGEEDWYIEMKKNKNET